MLVHRTSEIDTAAFRDFLNEPWNPSITISNAMQTKPEDLMPWKVHGERWHLGAKGFPRQEIAMGP